MDPLLWLVAAAIVTVVLLSLPLIQNWLLKGTPQAPPVVIEDAPVVVGRARRRREERGREEDEVEYEDESGKKVGTKKRKKIAEKAERKALREQEQAMREDEKKRETLRYEEEKKKKEEEESLRIRKDEEEKKRKELQENKELDEYLKLKASFVIEEEGFVEDGADNTTLIEFINYIKDTKVVYMEEIAAQFNLKTQVVIDRIHNLQRSGELTGVIDDRGKFIYITMDELKSIAKFIHQRGRVSITELASSSNNLIKIQQ